MLGKDLAHQRHQLPPRLVHTYTSNDTAASSRFSALSQIAVGISTMKQNQAVNQIDANDIYALFYVENHLEMHNKNLETLTSIVYIRDANIYVDNMGNGSSVCASKFGIYTSYSGNPRTAFAFSTSNVHLVRSHQTIATISKICNILVLGSENDAIICGGFTPKRVESEV